MKTERRPATYGEYIIITNAYANKGYVNGEVFEVSERQEETEHLYAGVMVYLHRKIYINDREYEVMV
jgi:hypothetical protein